jgi:hypothetical protein
MALKQLIAVLPLFAQFINAQSTSAAPSAQVTASSIVSIYLDDSFYNEFDPHVSIISANAQTTAYAFPLKNAGGGYTVGFNYTEINGPGQTWIYTTTENVPDGLIATCSSLPGALVYCTAGTYGDDPAQINPFDYTTPYISAWVVPITVTAGLEKLPSASSTATSTPSTATSPSASPGNSSGGSTPSATPSPSGTGSNPQSSSWAVVKSSGTGTSSGATYTGPVKVGTSGAGMVSVQWVGMLLSVAIIAGMAF